MEPLEGKFPSRTNNVEGSYTEEFQREIPLQLKRNTFTTIEFEDLTEDDYCAYCNDRYPIEKMTKEHVIPQAINGDNEPIIPACQPCNNKMGHEVDTKLSNHSALRAMSIKPSEGRGPQRAEKHSSFAKLKNGTILYGHFYTEFSTRDSWRPAFSPYKDQPDGSKWLHANVFNKNSSLPKGIKIYHPEDLYEVSYSWVDPVKSGLQTAFTKILLGFLYKLWGPKIVQKPAFDIFRKYITAVDKSGVNCRCAELGEETPVDLQDFVHTIWCSSEKQKLRGGVSLFGKVTLLIEVENFAVSFPGRILQIDPRLKA